MTRSVLLADTKGSSGHISLYKEYIKSLGANVAIALCGPTHFLDHFRDDGLALYRIEEAENGSRSRWTRAAGQLRSLLRCYEIFREGTFERLEFLSYDNFPMAIASHLFREGDIWLCDHNNIDRALAEPLHGLAFRALNKAIGHVALEPYIAEYLSQQFGFRTQHRAHPLRRIQGNVGAPERSRAYVFCPSRDCDPAFLWRLNRYCLEQGYELVARAREGAPVGAHAHYFTSFENYDQLLLHAEYVAIGVNYRYRVSGVFYEALANKKRMILNDCLFTRSVGSRAVDAIWI